MTKAAAGSLTLRVALLAALWVAAGLALSGWFVTDLAGRHILAAADARLSAQMDALVAALGVEPDGQLRLDRPLADPEFDRPLSGSYWQAGTLRSRSLWDSALPASSLANASDIAGPRGEPLRVLQRFIELQGAAAPVLVQVAGSREETERERARLRHGLALAFGLLGLGLVGGLVLQLVWAMAPLRRLRAALVAVRAGERERIGLAAPSEVAPLVEEVDALIAQNRATVERARGHVGNLAHALKTPAAVLRNALDEVDGPGAETARAQAEEMERILRHHLARARASALAVGGGATGVRAVVEEVASALRRLSDGVAIDVIGDAALKVRADRQDLVEMLGNLMENATRWATSRIAIEIRDAGAAVAITVQDDGPGLPEGSAAIAAARGVRLDEATPGTGLGLAIVADLATLYGGALDLAPSTALGGLCATLNLPRQHG